MKLWLGLAVLLVTLGALRCSPEDQPPSISEDTLKGKSAKRNLNKLPFIIIILEIFIYIFLILLICFDAMFPVLTENDGPSVSDPVFYTYILSPLFQSCL